MGNIPLLLPLPLPLPLLLVLLITLPLPLALVLYLAMPLLARILVGNILLPSPLPLPLPSVPPAHQAHHLQRSSGDPPDSRGPCGGHDGVQCQLQQRG